jgi:hypothetical protein
MDGVGDYTRRLAGELAALGHSGSLLALADSRVQTVMTGDFGDEDAHVPYLRLPAVESWPERIRRAKEFCGSAAPDWISWQIVPYGFDPRGLCFGLGTNCQAIAGGRRSEVMFHEIWIGEAMQAPLKQKLIGKLQRFILRDLLRKLSPRVVHTHMPLYQQLLEKDGWRPKILPLFGNIPLTPLPRAEWLKEKWPKDGGKFDLAKRSEWLIFVLFGSIHPEWNGAEFRQQAITAAKQAGKKCLLISIGRAGDAGDAILRELQREENDSWRLLELGQQSGEDISQCLLLADYGVSAVPPEYLFKSGTAAAMIDHGLPMIVTRSMFTYALCPPEKLVVGLKNVTRTFDLASLKKMKPESQLPAVAARFIKDLSQT